MQTIQPTMCLQVRPIDEVEDKLSRELLPITQWCRDNKMVLNPKKTKYMVIAS
jgi:hypothetical protein